MREVTNIVELNKLSATPCTEYLVEFVDGKVDAHQVFKKLGKEYSWLYKNSNYDLIGWEIANGCFNWEDCSWDLVVHCPQYFDSNLFNWEKDGRYVAMYCPQYFDPNLFNWEKYSWSVAQHCPEHFDPNLFNWEEYSKYVVMYCPQHFDPNLFNWEKYSQYVVEYCPEKLILKP